MAKKRSRDREELPRLIGSDDEEHYNEDDGDDDDEEDEVESQAPSDDGAACMVCGSTASGPGSDAMLLCDAAGCEHGCHLRCHEPRLHKVPTGDWFCGSCQPLGGNASTATEGFTISESSLRAACARNCPASRAAHCAFPSLSPPLQIECLAGTGAASAATPARLGALEVSPEAAERLRQFEALVGQGDEASEKKLHLRHAKSYTARLLAFEPERGAAAERRKTEMQNRIYELVQQHLNFFNGAKENPYHPFKTQAEYFAFNQAGKRMTNTTTWRANLRDLRRVAGDLVESPPKPTDLGRRHRRVPKLETGDEIMSLVDKMPKVPFQTKPIPPELLARLAGTRKGVGNCEFVFFSPTLAIQDFFMRQMPGSMHWDSAIEMNEDGERTFSGWWTGNAALAAQQRFCSDGQGKKVVSVAVYTDKANLSADSRHSVYPAVIEILNQDAEGRRSLTGPMLVGLIPMFHGTSQKIAAARLELWHWCMKELVEDLKVGCTGLEMCARFGSKDDVELSWRTCYPLVHTFLCDHVDAKCCCGLKGGNTFFPCNICGAAQHQLHKVDLAEFELRSPDDLKECRGARTACAKTEQSLTSQFTSGDISKEALTDGKRAARVELKLQQDMLDSMSGLDVEPALDRLGYVSSNEMVGIDTMHVVDQGIVPRIGLITAKYYNAQGKLAELNDSWRLQSKSDDLPRIFDGPLFKTDGKRIEFAAMPKASEMRQILQLLPNVVRSEPKVYAVWVALREWYELAYRKSYTMEQIVKLQEAAVRFQNAVEASPLSDAAAEKGARKRREVLAARPLDRKFDEICGICGCQAISQQPLLRCQGSECYCAYHAKCLSHRGSVLRHCPSCNPEEYPTFVLISSWTRPLQIIKWHMAMHMPSSIVLFGALLNINVGHLEAFHRLFKAFYRMGCKATTRVGRQMAEFMARRTAHLNVRAYQELLAKLGFPTAESISTPLPVRRKKRRLDSHPKPPHPRTRVGGTFYQAKDDPLPCVVLRSEHAAHGFATAEDACDGQFLDILIDDPRDDPAETQLVISGVNVAQVLSPNRIFYFGRVSRPTSKCLAATAVQVLKQELAAFEKRHQISDRSAGPFKRVSRLTLFGFVEVASEDGSSSIQLNATSYKGNRAQPAKGHFNTVRFKPGGRASKLQFAELILIFEATLSDDARHQLALVRTFTDTIQRRKISGVDCSDTLLLRGGFAVIRLTDLVDAYHIVPDVNFPKDPERFVANRHILASS